MVRSWFESYRPSLRRWAGVLAIGWLVGVTATAVTSIALLRRIAEDARATYGVEIPRVLDRNRVAIKVERLSSFVRTIDWTRDPQVERRTLLQLQTLAQGFDFDEDDRLKHVGADIVAGARRIIAAHAAMRAAAAGQAGDAGHDLERQAGQIGDEMLQALGTLSDYIVTDAALSADTMANRIQRNASRIENAWFAGLGLFVAFGSALLWIIQRHMLTPIAAAVRGLETISDPAAPPPDLPRARFFELDVINRAVEQYARFAGELRVANRRLHDLSRRDGLTGLTNRRGFDAELAEACRAAAEGGAPFALLLIDIDHFKLLNDRFGHPVGDECLRQVAATLQSACAEAGGRVARYGGEEFAAILPGIAPVAAREAAERIRAAVAGERLCPTETPGGVAVTVSIGLMPVAPGDGDGPEQVVDAADRALYRAKRDGRNRVRDAAAPDPSAAAAAA